MAIPIIDFRILVMEFLYISKISRTFRSSSKITIFKILAKNIRGLRIDIPRYCIKHKTKLWHCPFKNIHLCYPSLSKFKWNIVNIHWNKLTKLLNIDGVKKESKLYKIKCFHFFFTFERYWHCFVIRALVCFHDMELSPMNSIDQL